MTTSRQALGESDRVAQPRTIGEKDRRALLEIVEAAIAAKS